ncbi:hypothetical protein N7448_001132 [Penicillium atrosanguineum]|uniref:Uncharacterized protein n=1 Tax=Penicillium atrosanguineum TaxID=1132637 RepID=A0A9W9HL46_9EURO|nr:uncharacterized protein N7443_004530 [Penicillium atrosanguineum]KAJ5133848.1 hypothetical protein N7526_005213 [Penicillium atrosanguineum]KAJ5149554.1 hypothetical protein N7448_001132 [Penicillium atrosanguineum]KAJ5304870.1 hypothetical protein N7443_004530 [Penicillium atrosanguineum]KAJ5324334.1 hypothetical protein N7476_002934 [Penicillium atrosanguineum]
MPETSGHSSAVSGGSSAVPTPANNSSSWGDKVFRKGGSENEPINEGEGHVHASNPRDTIGNFLGLQDQKTRAENKFKERAGLVDGQKPYTEDGGPTCAGEDHTFAGRKPGGSDTWPGWETTKSFFGAGNVN